MHWLMAVLLAAGPTPENVRAQERLRDAQKLMSSEKFEEAALTFQEAIELDPVLIMAHYGLGQANMALKRYPPAVAAFTGAREAFHRLAAEHLDRRMENETAIDDRIRLLQDKIRENQDRPVNPNSAEGRRLEGMMQQWEIEIATLQRSKAGGHSIAETPAFLSLALGSAHFRSGQLAEAEREYRAALAVKPRLGETRNNLAVVLLITGRPAEAKEQLQIAEKNGFTVAPGLRRDVDAALAKAVPGRP